MKGFVVLDTQDVDVQPVCHDGLDNFVFCAFYIEFQQRNMLMPIVR